MKTVLYYISEHGLGHLTRSVAIVRDIMTETLVFIRNSNIDFLKQSLPKIQVLDGKTDQGTIIAQNSVSIDWKSTELAIKDWYSSFQQITEKEKNSIKKIQPDLIISDISPIPLYAAKQLEIPSIAISNFTWLDIFSKLDNFSLENLESAYEKTNLCIELPLNTDMNIFKNKKQVGFVSRNITKKGHEIREKLNISESKFLIFINLPKFFTVSLKNFSNLQIISTGAKTNVPDTIFINPWIEGQDLINASDLVVSKCGYGMMSECLSAGTPFQLVADENHPEQHAIINALDRYGMKNLISNWENGHIEIDFNTLKYFESFKNDNLNVKNIIMEFLK